MGTAKEALAKFDELVRLEKEQEKRHAPYKKISDVVGLVMVLLALGVVFVGLALMILGVIPIYK